jgi:predicted ATPase/class 3 adenylate cyclase/DNA-binding winged helix-turn-helix (wHTH) protein
MLFTFDAYTLDTRCYELRRAEVVCPLEPKAFNLLVYLLEHRERVVSKEEALEQLWPGEFVVDAVVTRCLRLIRRAVGDDGTHQRIIQTVRRRGYRFLAPVDIRQDAEMDATGLPLPESPGAGEFPHRAPAAAAGAPALLQDDPPAAPPPAPLGLPFPEQDPARGLGRPEAERRQVTLLFCDLVDSTGFAGQLDPEDYRAVLQAYLETCATVITRFGGTLAKFLGDGALVCFGYPQAHDDDPQQAVRAGLGIAEALTQANTRLAQTWGVQLAVRIGIHTGLVVAGDLVVGETRTPQVVVGEAPNIAARLRDLAASNTVVCSAATARLVEGYFTLEALGPQRLKGVATPLSVYRVVGARAAQTRLDVALTRGLTPLVGREPELALLRECWAQAVDGQGQVIMVNGEPGIGKSRLVQALTAHLAGTAHTPLVYHCSPYAQQTAFYPVVTALQQLLRVTPAAPAAEPLQRLEALLAPYGFPLAEVVPLVAALLALPLPAHYPPLTLTPQRQRHKTLEALVAWVLAVTRRQPVLCLVEDLHWADPTTLEWLGLLVAQAPTARLLLLLVCRPEFRLPWPLHAHLTPVTLRRLPPPQVEQLIGHVARGMALPRAVVQQIATQTDGVPLFVEELTKTVLEAGGGQASQEGAARSDSLPALTIPATLQDSLMARLDRLPTGKVVAQLGATIGRTFAAALLQAVTTLDEAAVQTGLRQLVEAELVYPRGVGAEATYAFKHALIQEAAYQSLLKRMRRQYHQRIAQVLEAQFPDTVATQPELLAQHLTEAGRPAQAIPYWQQAGQRALERSAYREAAQHLTQGLALLLTRPETPGRAQQELALQLALGTALQATQGLAAPAVEQPFARARALCAQVGDTPQVVPVLRGLSRFYANRGEWATARALGEQLLRLAQRAALPTHRLTAHDIIGNAYYHVGDYGAARTHCEQGIALTDLAAPGGQGLHGHATPEVTCRTFAAHALWCLGFPAQAIRRSQDALAQAQALAHPPSLTIAQHYAALLHQRRREAPLAQAQAEALVTLGTAQELPLQVGFGTVSQGWALAMQGQGEAGVALMHQGMAAVWATGARGGRPFDLVRLAEAMGHAGHVTEGLHLLEEALTAFAASERGDMRAEAYRLQGDLLRRQAVAAAAQVEACFQQALAIARGQQAKSWELRAAMSLSRLWQHQGKRAEAHDLLAPIYGWFTEGFDTADLQEAKALLEDLGG